MSPRRGPVGEEVAVPTQLLVSPLLYGGVRRSPVVVGGVRMATAEDGAQRGRRTWPGLRGVGACIDVPERDEPGHVEIERV